MNNLKIIVAFHGSVHISRAFDMPDLYVPIYGGKSVTKYIPFETENMQPDNEGDNISWMNPIISELTCFYWAAKHLDKIGNPDYIGLNHYRRLFPDIRNEIESIKDEFIITASKPTTIPVLDYAHLQYGIGNELEEFFNEFVPKEETEVYQYFCKQTEYPEKNLFIIPTSKLDGYIDFVLKVARFLYDRFPYQYTEGMPYTRRCSKIMEFVTAYYLTKLMAQGLTRYSVNYEYPWKGIY